MSISLCVNTETGDEMLEVKECDGQEEQVRERGRSRVQVAGCRENL